jgi:Leucine-rich repeat (LRR) protein
MLTKTLILSRFSKKSDLSEITKLNIYAENIEDISILSSMPKLEYLSLSSNKISSLSALSNCIYLREIYLRNNNISSFEELNNLRHLFNLKILWLEGNPICDDNFYRKKVLNILPQVTSLDNKKRILRRERANVQIRNQSEQKRLRKEFDFNFGNISKSQRKKILMRRVFSYYNDTNDEIETKIIETSNNISLKHNNKKYNNYIHHSSKKNDLAELKIRFNTRINYEQKEKDKSKKIYRKLKLKLKTEENKNNNIHIVNVFNNLNQMPRIGDNNITVQNSIPTEGGQFNFFRRVNKDKLFVNNCYGNNNYVMKAIYLLVDKMNVNDLISLKKVINKRISVLGNIN